MRHILIVEKCDEIRNHLVESARKINPDIKIHDIECSKDALKIVNQITIDAFFISVNKEEYNGISLAEELRTYKKYQFTPLVFIASNKNLESDAFHKLHCFDYLVQPISESELQQILKKILVDYMQQKTNEQYKLYLKFKDKMRLLDIDSIIYIEYLDRRIIIHTVDEIIKYRYIPLKKFKEQLSAQFIQVHQSFIINKSYITLINSSANIISLGEIEQDIPIGRSYKKHVIS